MERYIGEKFKYSDNINLIAVEQDESKIDICGNCVFNRNTCYKEYDIVGDCSSLTRTDDFYVARDKNKLLWLYLGKPERRQEAFVNSYGTYGGCMIN